MTKSNLTTDQYCEQTDDAGEVATIEPAPGSIAAPSSLERFTSRLSLIIGAALVVSVTILAIGYLGFARDRVSARAKKSTHALDWLLWFGGAEDDQTFEKYIKEASAKSKREWDEKYRSSPAYQFDPEEVDWKRVQWKIEPVPLYKPPARRSK